MQVEERELQAALPVCPSKLGPGAGGGGQIKPGGGQDWQKRPPSYPFPLPSLSPNPGLLPFSWNRSE